MSQAQPVTTKDEQSIDATDNIISVLQMSQQPHAVVYRCDRDEYENSNDPQWEVRDQQPDKWNFYRYVYKVEIIEPSRVDWEDIRDAISKLRDSILSEKGSDEIAANFHALAGKINVAI